MPTRAKAKKPEYWVERHLNYQPIKKPPAPCSNYFNVELVLLLWLFQHLSNESKLDENLAPGSWQ